jgi:hypothetical protein
MSEIDWTNLLAYTIGSGVAFGVGHMYGQIRVQREHLRFLRESSTRADEMMMRLVEMRAEQDLAADPATGSGGEEGESDE